MTSSDGCAVVSAKLLYSGDRFIYGLRKTMERVLSIALLICLHLIPSEGAGCYCYNNDKTRCYKFENQDRVRFWEAQRRCEVGGGSLAILDTAETFDYVYNLMVQKDYWIGLEKTHDTNLTEGVWMNGQPLNESLYDFKFQLDDARHDCVRMRYAKALRVADYPCTGVYYYVCQYDTSNRPLKTSQRQSDFRGHRNVAVDSPESMDLANQNSKLRCSSVCASSESCRAFSYSRAARACRLHSYDLKSLTSFRTDDRSWISYEKDVMTPANCEDIVTLRPCVKSGVFTVHPSLSLPPFSVHCRMGNDDINWVVLMRKSSHSNFDRTLADYVTGFGDLERDFWLGLEKMSALTVPWFEYELFVQFYNGSAHVSATYKNFSVRSNGGSYVISYDAFIDGAVDYLSGIHGNVFGKSPERCEKCQAAWWQGAESCHCDPSVLMMRLVRRVHG